MKKLAALLLLLLIGTAQAANSPPTGSNGDIQFNNNGQWGPYGLGSQLAVTTSGGKKFLNATTSGGGGGTPAGIFPQLQYTTGAAFAALSTDTLASYAAHNTVANGISYDPRDTALGSNPAICAGYNIFTSDGHTLTYNYTIPFAGSSSSDNTNFMVFSEPGDGSGSATILNTSQFSVTGVNSGVGGTITLNSSVPNGQLIIVVHDDANGFINAASAAASSGGYVSVPDSCTIYGTQASGTVLAEGAQLIGQSFVPNYGFQGQGTKPILRVVAPTGSAPNFGFNISGKNQQFYEGFEITTNVPSHNQLGFLNVPVLIGANGSSGAGGGQNPGIVVQYVTFNSGAVGFGAPIGGNSAYIFAVLRYNNFTANTAGVYGPLSDLVAVGNDFAQGNGSFGSIGSSGGMVIGPQQGAVGVAGASRVESNRFEFNREGIVVQAGSLISFEGNQFDGNTDCGLDLRGSWSFLNITGGWFRGNANGGAGGTGVTTAGQDAHICINGAGNGLHLTNVNFLDGYARGFQAPLGSANANTPPYVLDVNTAGSGVDDIDFEGATAQFAAGNNGASVTDFAIYRNGRPTNLKIDLNGQAVQGKIASGAYPGLIRGIPPSQWLSYNAFGDKYTTSTAYFTPNYNTIIGTGTNVGSSPYFITEGQFDCDNVDLNIFPNYNPSNTGNPLVTWLPSVTDPTFGAGFYQNHLTDTNACRLAGLTWMAIPQQYKTYAQAASVTTTGSWGNFSSYGGALGLTSTTQNSALSFTVTTQSPVYVNYELQATATGVASGGIFTVSVDGSLAATVSSGGNGAWTFACGSLCPTSQAPAAVRIPIPATTSGSHTITTSVLSSTSTANPVTILGVWQPPQKPYVGGNPTVYLGGQLYEYNNAQSAATAAFNQDEMSQANLLLSDGLDVNFVDLRGSKTGSAYINSTTDMSSTTGTPLAPNATGQQHIADAFGGAIQYQKSSGSSLGLDPRNYGAVCNAIYADGRNQTGTGGGYGVVTMTASSPVISISGYTFSQADVGKSIALTGGSHSVVDPGIGTTTIISVDTGANTATLAAAPLISHTDGYAVFGHNDTAGFLAAENASIPDPSTNAGGGFYVQVPNNCLVANLTMPNNVTLQGSATQVGYTYVQSQPIMYFLSTGFSEDTNKYAIDITEAALDALKGFEIRGLVFPFPPFGGTGMTSGQPGASACVGTDSGTKGYNDGILLETMTFNQCWVGVGTALNNASQTGHIFMQSHWNEFASNYMGWYGNFSDPASVDDVFTGNGGAGIVFAGLPGSGFTSASGRLIGDRFEENGSGTSLLNATIGQGGGGIICNSCRDLHIEGNEFQFNEGWALQLLGAWSEFNMTGGMMQDNGQQQVGNFVGSIATTTLTVTGVNSGTIKQYQQIFGSGIPAGTYITALGTGVGSTGTYTINNSLSISSENITSSARTDIMLQGASAIGGLYLSNVQFPSAFSTLPDYIIFGATSGTNNPRVSIDGGLINCVAPNISYNKTMDNWNSSTPTFYRVTVPNCKQFIQDLSDFSINASSALGLQTTNATAGTILDMFGATTTANSSVGLPKGTTANRPGTPVKGMIRYNTTSDSFEGYNGGWGSLGGAGTVQAKTADYPITAFDTNSTFTNTGAAGSVNFTLPTAAASLNYCFYIDAAQTFIVTAETGHTIRNGLSATSSGGNLTSSGVGNQFCLRALNTTEWYVYSGPTGQWTVN